MAIIGKNFKYKKIKNFFNKEELNVLQTYCLKKIDDSDRLVNSLDKKTFSLSFYDDLLMETFLSLKKPLVEKESGLNLLETYSYWRYYGFGSHLSLHEDRPSCEISISACINKTDNWPFIIDNKKIELEIGEAILYLGIESTHGRLEDFEGDGLAQVFMHYVDKNGLFTHHANDNYFRTFNKYFSEEDKENIKKMKNKDMV